MIDSFTGENRFLSNFFPCKIWYEGIEYPSVEHAYQAAKTLDTNDRIAISKLKKAADSKKQGYTVKLREDWELIKIHVMTELVRQKFTHPSFKAKLLNTGDALLIEGNYWGDRFWGQCEGTGENWLGKILMNIRNELKTPVKRDFNAN